MSARRGPLGHLKPHLAAADPGEGGAWIGRARRPVPAVDWRATGLPLRTLAEAVRAKCLDCCGGQPGEVRRCMALTCPIWPFRMGTDPFRGLRAGLAEIGSRRPIFDPGGGISGETSEATEPPA